MSNLKQKIVGGIGWTMSSQIATQLVSFGVTLVLVRLLSPRDYGLYALVGTVLGFVQIFNTLGFSQALIQKEKVTSLDYSTAFWSTLLLSLLLCGIVIVSSPVAVVFFKEPLVAPILKVASLSLVISALGTMQLAQLQKSLAFKRIMLIEFLTALFAGIASIVLAINKFGVWSLVLGSLTGQVLALPILWKMSEWKPQIAFSKQAFSEFFAFGAHLTVGGIINYFMRNMDNVIIGKVLGSTALGYYSLAYNLMLKPLQYISANVGRVLFPALSSIKGDKDTTRKVYLKAVHYISLITFPMMSGLLLVAPSVVEVVYGPKWMPVVPVLQILCLVGAMQSIGTTVGTIYLSQGRADLQMKYTIIFAPIVIGSFIVGVYWGIEGVAAGYALATSSIWVWSHKIANKLIDLEILTVFRELIPALCASILMCAALGSLYFLQQYFLGQTPTAPCQLAMMIPAGVVSYIVALALFFPITFRKLRALATRKSDFG